MESRTKLGDELCNSEKYNYEGRSDKIVGNLCNYEVRASLGWSIKAGKLVTLCVFLSLFVFAVLVASFLAFSLLLTKMERLEAEIAVLKQLSITQNDGFTERLNASKEKALKFEKISRVKRAVGGKVTAVHLEGKPGFFTSPASGEIRLLHASNWSNQFTIPGFQLQDQNSRIVVPNGGLYLIYAQIYYTVENKRCSFEICVQNRETTDKCSRLIAECSVGQIANNPDVSCFTAVVHVLKAGESVFIRQKQMYANYSMGPGKTFLGLVSLSSE